MDVFGFLAKYLLKTWAHKKRRKIHSLNVVSLQPWEYFLIYKLVFLCFLKNFKWLIKFIHISYFFSSFFLFHKIPLKMKNCARKKENNEKFSKTLHTSVSSFERWNCLDKVEWLFHNEYSIIAKKSKNVKKILWKITKCFHWFPEFSFCIGKSRSNLNCFLIQQFEIDIHKREINSIAEQPLMPFTLPW